MADVRQIVFEFLGDATNLDQTTSEIESNMGTATESTDKMSLAMGKIKPAAIAAGAAAAAAAVVWAKEGVDMATTANKVAGNFENVFGDAEALSFEIETLAGHMGIAEHEAMALLASTGALGQSMGMSASESEAFASQMFILAGDMARFNPEAGTAAEAMEVLTKATNGQVKGLAAWDVSLKSAEIQQRALADTGKETAAQLTQEEKAMATLALVTEKQAGAQGMLNEAIADGNTEFKEATADVDDMQVAVGQALMPVKKLAMEGFMVLADILVALEPAISAIGKVLDILMKIISPLLDVLGKLLGWFFDIDSALGKLLNPIQAASNAFSNLSSKIRSAFSWTPPSWMQRMGIRGFSSGGEVPGPTGAPRMVMAHGGETITPAGSSKSSIGGGGGGGMVVNVTVNAGVGDPYEIGREIADILGEYSRQAGPIALNTRTAD